MTFGLRGLDLAGGHECLEAAQHAGVACRTAEIALAHQWQSPSTSIRCFTEAGV